MRKIFFIMSICLLLVSCSFYSLIHTKNNCYQCEKCNNGTEDVCNNPDEYASYGKSDKDIVDFINSIKFPVMDKTNFTYNLVVCKHGNIVAVRPETVTTVADSVVLDKIKRMHRWKPALKDGENVKSIFRLHFYVKPQ